MEQHSYWAHAVSKDVNLCSSLDSGQETLTFILENTRNEKFRL